MRESAYSFFSLFTEWSDTTKWWISLECACSTRLPLNMLTIYLHRFFNRNTFWRGRSRFGHDKRSNMSHYELVYCIIEDYCWEKRTELKRRRIDNYSQFKLNSYSATVSIDYNNQWIAHFWFHLMNSIVELHSFILHISRNLFRFPIDEMELLNL